MNEQLADDFEMVREVLVRGHVESDRELWNTLYPVVLYNPVLTFFLFIVIFVITFVLVESDAFRGLGARERSEEIGFAARRPREGGGFALLILCLGGFRRTYG